MNELRQFITSMRQKQANPINDGLAAAGGAMATHPLATMGAIGGAATGSVVGAGMNADSNVDKLKHVIYGALTGAAVGAAGGEGIQLAAVNAIDKKMKE